MPEPIRPDLMPSPEQRRVAAQQAERARIAVNTGNYDYAISLLQTCCKLDPSNLIYRKALRSAQKTKWGNNLKGSMWAWLTNWRAWARLRLAQQRSDHRTVLECGEQILSKNPWDTTAQLTMALAAEKLGIVSSAVWILEQARQKNPKNSKVNRALAVMLERQGLFKQAMQMWEMVVKGNPRDLEAVRKLKDLAATDTIVRGRYHEAAVENEPALVRDTPTEPAGLPASAAESHLARQLEPLKTRLAADPKNAGTYLRIADVYRQAELPDKVREVLLEGLNASNKDFEIVCALIDLEIDPFRQNLKITEEKIKANPGDEMLQMIRGQLLKEINSREMDFYRQRTDRLPSDSRSRLELGVRLLRAEKIDEAIQELQHARRDPRCRWNALVHLGHAFQAKKNTLLAKRNFEEALQNLPGDQEAIRKELLFELARSAAAERDWADAVRFGMELANLDYAYRDIGRLVEDWQSGRHQTTST